MTHIDTPEQAAEAVGVATAPKKRGGRRHSDTQTRIVVRGLAGKNCYGAFREGDDEPIATCEAKSPAEAVAKLKHVMEEQEQDPERWDGMA